MNSELTEQIEKQLQWQASRIDIDRGLLEQGYNPVDIELAWQLVAKPPQKPTFDWSHLFNRETCIDWLFGLAVLSWSCIFYINYESSGRGGGLYVFSPIIFIFTCIIIVSYQKRGVK